MTGPIERLSRPARVVVVGVSGSGKTTLSAELAERLRIRHIELDALWHLEDWSNPPLNEFRAQVDELTSAEEWVLDGNYSVAQDLAIPRATAVVWIHLPRWLGTTRAVRRTIARVVRREVLWNGNRERWTTVLADWHPIRWSWDTYPVKAERYGSLFASPLHAGVQKVKLTSPADVQRWLAAQGRAPSVGPPAAG